jgi:death-on-curing protein
MAILFLTLEDVLIIHADQIDRYGGSLGVRDIGLLESAVAMARMQFEGDFVHHDMFEMAASYLFHISKNHPFIDGNKRTALASALVFLEINNMEIEIDDDLLYEMVLDVIHNLADKKRIAEIFHSFSRKGK